jgi:hypothetical protein
MNAKRRRQTADRFMAEFRLKILTDVEVAIQIAVE